MNFASLGRDSEFHYYYNSSLPPRQNDDSIADMSPITWLARTLLGYGAQEQTVTTSDIAESGSDEYNLSHNNVKVVDYHKMRSLPVESELQRIFNASGKKTTKTTEEKRFFSLRNPVELEWSKLIRRRLGLKRYPFPNMEDFNLPNAPVCQIQGSVFTKSFEEFLVSDIREVTTTRNGVSFESMLDLASACTPNRKMRRRFLSLEGDKMNNNNSTGGGKGGYTLTEYMIDQTSPRSALWMPDGKCSSCFLCSAPFTTFRRRHHCRLCGQVFCYKCSSCFLPGQNPERLFRVCESCSYRKSKKKDNLVCSDHTTSQPRSSVVPGSPADEEKTLLPSTAEETMRTVIESVNPSAILNGWFETNNHPKVGVQNNTLVSRTNNDNRISSSSSDSKERIYDINLCRIIELFEVAKPFIEESLEACAQLHNLESSYIPIASFIARNIVRNIPIENAASPLDEYIQVMTFPDGKITDSFYLAGVMFPCNLLHKGMATEIKNCRFMLLEAALDFQRGNNIFTSLDTLREQEATYLDILVSKVLQKKPNLLLCHRRVAGYAHEKLRSHGITVLSYISLDTLRRVALFTGAELIPSLEHMESEPKVFVGTCEWFGVENLSIGSYAILAGSTCDSVCTVVLCGCTIRSHDDPLCDSDPFRRLVIWAIKLSFSLLIEFHYILSSHGKIDVIPRRDVFEKKELLSCSKASSSDQCDCLNTYIAFWAQHACTSPFTKISINEQCAQIWTNKLLLAAALRISESKEKFEFVNNDKTHQSREDKKNPFKRTPSCYTKTEKFSNPTLSFIPIRPTPHIMENEGAILTLLQMIFAWSYSQKTEVLTFWLARQQQCSDRVVETFHTFSGSDVSLKVFLENKFYRQDQKRCPGDNSSCRMPLLDHSLCVALHNYNLIFSLVKKVKPSLSNHSCKLLCWRYCVECKTQVCDPSPIWDEIPVGKVLDIHLLNSHTRSSLCQHRLFRDHITFFELNGFIVSMQFEHLSGFDLVLHRSVASPHSDRMEVSRLADLPSPYTDDAPDEVHESVYPDDKLNSDEVVKSLRSYCEILSTAFNNAEELLLWTIDCPDTLTIRRSSQNETINANLIILADDLELIKKITTLFTSCIKSVWIKTEASLINDKLTNKNPQFLFPFTIATVISNLIDFCTAANSSLKQELEMKDTEPRQSNQSEAGVLIRNIELPNRTLCTKVIVNSNVPALPSLSASPNFKFDYRRLSRLEGRSTKQQIRLPLDFSHLTEGFAPVLTCSASEFSPNSAFVGVDPVPSWFSFLLWDQQTATQDYSRAYVLNVCASVKKNFNHLCTLLESIIEVLIQFHSSHNIGLPRDATNSTVPFTSEDVGGMIGYVLRSKLTADWNECELANRCNISSQYESEQIQCSSCHDKTSPRDYMQSCLLPILQKKRISQPCVHQNVIIEDGTGTLNIVIYFGKQFHALRHILCGGDDKFVRSVCRTEAFDPTGGKSGVPFIITRDKKYLIKQLNKYELRSFLNNGPTFLDYYTKVFFALLPSTMTAVHGLFHMSYCDSYSKEIWSRKYLVMDNLLSGMNPDHHVFMFDLKGVGRHRYVVRYPSASNECNVSSDMTPEPRVSLKQDDKNSFYLDQSCEKTIEDSSENLQDKPLSQCDSRLRVLWDQNFREYTNGIALMLRTKSHSDYLETAFFNDTLLLAGLGIVDYSLLLIVNETLGQICVGMIDYLRPYTWDKQMENMGKSLVYLTSGLQEPTVISPSEYQSRFRRAMKSFFSYPFPSVGNTKSPQFYFKAYSVLHSGPAPLLPKRELLSSVSSECSWRDGSDTNTSVVNTSSIEKLPSNMRMMITWKTVEKVKNYLIDGIKCGYIRPNKSDFKAIIQHQFYLEGIDVDVPESALAMLD